MDLGKPTKRGVRKCPKCGVINGTRGLQCKNASCEFVFKEGIRKKAFNVFAKKVITGSNIKIYSVRMRDKGPDYRGFVQLPLVHDPDGNPAKNVSPKILLSVLGSTAKCYVDACARSKPTNNQSVQVACSHIKSAIESSSVAQELPIGDVGALNIPLAMRSQMMDLVTQNSAPLVQRVTQNCMVVKCKANVKKPLGYLHMFFTSAAKLQDRGSASDSFFCSCRDFKVFHFAEDNFFSHQQPIYVQICFLQTTSGLTGGKRLRRCVHLYACLAAFTNDSRLSLEFAPYINLLHDARVLILPLCSKTTFTLLYLIDHQNLKYL